MIPIDLITARSRWAFGIFRPAAIFLVLAILMAFPTQISWASQSGLSVETSERERPNPSLSFCYQGKVPDTRLVVVDKSRQRIMVFRYLGQMVLEHEYPSATGVKFGHKHKEGDERTPVGIYFTTHRYNDRKVTIFGKKAIHLNYPNPLDRMAGRKGNGIFIHGTNGKLKDRSTNGCVVMRNEDLDHLAPLISDGVTPVVVVERFSLGDLDSRIQACKELRSLEKAALARAQAQLEPGLTMITTNKNALKKLSKLAPRVANLSKTPKSRTKIETTGYILLGLGEQWVLVADQIIAGPKRKKVPVTRRHYFTGKSPGMGQVVQGEVVVADLASARTLASWAPAARKKLVPEPVPKAAPSPENEIKQMLASWLKSWQQKNLRKYISYYDRQFRTGKMNRKAWKRQKAYLNRVYKKITVRASNIKISIKGSRARVSFVQHYRSDWHKDVGRKDLKLVKRKNGWRIISETWSKMSGRASAAGPERTS